MKKTLTLTLTLALCGLGLQAQAADLTWKQDDLTKPASITDSGSWASSQAPGSDDAIHFTNGQGNVLIDSELTVNQVLFNSANQNPIAVNLTLDFASAGKLTSNGKTNFFQDWFKPEGASITFKAALAPQEEGAFGTRTLLHAKSDYGIWNFTDLLKSGNEQYASALTANFGDNYNYVGLIKDSDWDTTSAAMNDGDAYLVIKGDALEVRWKGGAAVPEPTTSTLSLLALAGLCLRRRRCA